jgi:hypothetical protein
MEATKTVFLISLFSGIIALVAGIGITRFHWRKDIPPYGRNTRMVDVIFHPEKYVKDGPLRIIRSLNLVGTFLLIGAAGEAIHKIFQIIR